MLILAKKIFLPNLMFTKLQGGRHEKIFDRSGLVITHFGGVGR
jgi:hypothetical protein